MGLKRKLIKIMNRYIDENFVGDIESFYGKGSKIKVKNLTESYTCNSILIDAVIILGEEINEDVMHVELCDLLLRESLEPIYPNVHVKTMISWDESD
jgi:hypothetical protein